MYNARIYPEGQIHEQATISTTHATRPIPNPPPNVDPSEVYSPTPANCPSAIYRGDALFSFDDDPSIQKDSKWYRPVVASLANRPRPKKGEEDDWCNNAKFMGIAKTTQDPGNGFVGWNSPHRIAGHILAATLAGGTTIPYNGFESVAFGDLIIWGPAEGKSSQMGEHLSTRPIPILKPLNWSILKNFHHNACFAMLEKQQTLAAQKNTGSRPPKTGAQQKNKSTWSDLARTKKMDILLHVASGVLILLRRGLIEVVSPNSSRKKAIEKKYSYKLRDAISRKASTQELEGIVEEEKREIEELEGDFFIEETNSVGYVFLPEGGDSSDRDLLGDPLQDDLFPIDRNGESFVNVAKRVAGMGSNHANLLAQQKQQQDLSWLFSALGVSGKSKNSNLVMENVVLDILTMSSAGSLEGPKFHSKYVTFDKTAISADPVSFLEDFVLSLKDHAGEASRAQEDCRQSILNRVIGSSMSGTNAQVGTMGARKDCTLDVIVGKVVM